MKNKVVLGFAFTTAVCPTAPELLTKEKERSQFPVTMVISFLQPSPDGHQLVVIPGPTHGGAAE